jgi:hemerythrin
MPVIEWSDTYLLGIEQIDQHHRHLLTLLNNTYDVFVSHGQKVEVEKVIGELINYATYHFAAEELLMSQNAYSQAKEHLKEHDDFIEQIKAHQQEFHDGRIALSLELIVFLQDWLLEHILQSDKVFVDFVRPKLGISLAGVRINLA